MKTTAFDEEATKKDKIGVQMITVRGIVIPVDWDEEGNALAAAILGPGEEEYFVEEDEEGKELLGLMQQEVEVVGVVEESIHGHKIIKVKSYELKTV